MSRSSFSVEGTPHSTVTVVADGAGMWFTTVTPQPGEEGLWTVEATADGEVCTGTTSFPVFGVTPIACSIQATVFGGSATQVNIGEEVLIEGFDFVPGTVDIIYSVNAVHTNVTVTADGSGMFTTSVIPVAGQEGLWTVEVTDAGQAVCTATTSSEVLGAAPTPPQGQLPNVATAPPPPVIAALDAWRRVLVLAAGTLRQALKRIHA